MALKALKLKLMIVIVGGIFTTAGGLQAQSSDAPNAERLKPLVEAMRKDLRTQKQSLIDEAMGLDAADKAKFWTVYQGFQKELDAIWDVRLANVKKYAENFNSMTDGVADQLTASALQNEQQLTALKKKYYAQFKSAIGAKPAARWLQAETTIGSLMMLQLLSELPLLH